ncbi:MAG: type II toxin-antitoxin system Phd/YefM family antitoxin [Gaiellales bacterium]
MAQIPQKELRNNVGAVLRRAEGGERLVITVAGRPVAELGPITAARRWVPGDQLDELRRAAPADPQRLRADIERMPGGLADPFMR